MKGTVSHSNDSMQARRRTTTFYAHPEVAEESKSELAGFQWRIEEAIFGNGPWVKKMHGPMGRTLRVRVRRRRLLFSWQVEDGVACVWLHEIGWRREIYHRDAGAARARAWQDADKREDFSTLGYLPLERTDSHRPGILDQEPPNILPALSEEQGEFVRNVIPLEDDARDKNAFVFMAKGPPGSGKTVVAAEVARDAFLDSPNSQLGQAGADVVVLVPSGKLVRQYRDDLRLTALLESTSLAQAKPSSEPRLWIERFSEFFSAFSTPESSVLDVEKWWQSCLRLPALRRWFAQHPCVAEPRFATLLHACFGFEEEPGGGAKDALSKFDRPLYQALRALNTGERAAIERARADGKIRLRWEVALEAADKLRCFNEGRPTVIVVDEAQDLIPAQWRVLVESAFHRHRNKVGQTVVALLGDENQRVAPTAFAWTDVSTFIRGLHDDLANGAGCVQSELKGSFRIRREIAKVANTLMVGQLVDDRAKRASVANPDELRDGGSVVVVVAGDPQTAIENAMTSISAGMAPDDRLVHIGHDARAVTGVDIMDPREAKGLEYGSLVASSLFGDELNWDTRSRAYVALTRAKDNIALVLTNQEWDRVASAWDGLVEHEPPERLAEVLLGLVLRTEGDDQSDEQRSRIDNLIEEADLANGEFPVQVFERASRLVETEAAHGLVGHLDDVLRRRPEWDEALRKFAADPAQETLERVGAWLLQGDVGAALSVAQHARDARGALPHVRAIAEAEQPLAAASLELRKIPDARGEAHLIELMVAAFWVDAQRAFAQPDFQMAPPYKIGQKRRSDVLARAVIQSVLAAQDAGIEEIDRLVTRVESRRKSIAVNFGKRLVQRRAKEALDRQIAALVRYANQATENGR